LKTIAFVNSKGGTGKSTLAAAIGVAAEASGEKVFMIDLDPQGSLSAWGERRKADTPPVDRIAPDRLPAAIAGLAAGGYTVAIIDTPGLDTPATAAAMRAADLSLIPARASTLDLEATRPTLAALARLDRRYAFVLNACPAGRSGASPTPPGPCRCWAACPGDGATDGACRRRWPWPWRHRVGRQGG
jgi:chromosome partitioning protein